MKITIDTKEDSHEEIRKVIRMLTHLVGEQPETNAPRNIFEDSNSFGQEQYNSSEPSQSSSSPGGLFSMFGSASSPSTQSIPSDPSSLAEQSSTEEEPAEKSDDVPEVIPY